MEQITVSEMDGDTLRLMYEEHHVTITEIARLFGKNSLQVQAAMFANGVVPVGHQRRRSLTVFVLDDKKGLEKAATSETIRRLFLEGKTDSQIASACGATVDLIRGRREKLGLRSQDRPGFKWGGLSSLKSSSDGELLSDLRDLKPDELTLKYGVPREVWEPYLASRGVVEGIAAGSVPLYIKGQKGLLPVQALDALNALKSFSQEGRAPSKAVWDRSAQGTRYPSHVLESYFGTWRSFASAAGLILEREETSDRSNTEDFLLACRGAGRPLTVVEYGDYRGGAKAGHPGYKYLQRFRRLVRKQPEAWLSSLQHVCLDPERSSAFLDKTFSEEK